MGIGQLERDIMCSVVVLVGAVSGNMPAINLMIASLGDGLADRPSALLFLAFGWREYSPGRCSRGGYSARRPLFQFAEWGPPLIGCYCQSRIEFSYRVLAA
jgi:hypothetical protein